MGAGELGALTWVVGSQGQKTFLMQSTTYKNLFFIVFCPRGKGI